MFCQERPPLSKLDRQKPLIGILVIVGCMSIQPHHIIANWISDTHFYVGPHHQVKLEAMKDAACNKCFLQLLHLTMYP